MQHYTTIEQSKKLVELGLNFKTADMGYNGIKDRDVKKLDTIELLQLCLIWTAFLVGLSVLY